MLILTERDLRQIVPLDIRRCDASRTRSTRSLPNQS